MTFTMSFNSFLIGEFEVFQIFGENPNGYKAFNLVAHNGIDVVCEVGTPVYSIADGVVVKVQYDAGGYGMLVKVQSKGFAVIYAHLSYQAVKVGNIVLTGQMIGRTGNTGNSSGPHIHFEVRPDNENKNNGYNGAVDPLKYAPLGLVDHYDNKDTTPIETPANDKMAVNFTGIVNSDVGVRVRSGPGKNYPQVGSKDNGASLRISEISTKELWGKIGENEWCAIRYDDEQIINIKENDG
jgi:hypothetical protein